MKYEEALFIMEEVMDDYRPTGGCEFAFWKALTSLKKQIPKKPYKSNEPMLSEYQCPNCGTYWDCDTEYGLKHLGYKYCPCCGQAIDGERWNND